jgi:ribonucleoside-diphosphate reductase alpha chain
VFAAEYRRLVRHGTGEAEVECAVDYAVHRYRDAHGSHTLPPAFLALPDVDPEAQLAMQAALQEHVDNAISKTVSVPEAFEFDRFRRLFDTAYALGLKGCTTFRPNRVTGEVLMTDTDVDSCCPIREHRAQASRP